MLLKLAGTPQRSVPNITTDGEASEACARRLNQGRLSCSLGGLRENTRVFAPKLQIHELQADRMLGDVIEESQ